MKTKPAEKNRWYRYWFPSNGGTDYKYFWGIRECAKDEAEDYMNRFIPASAHWRGMKVSAIKRPPQLWLDNEVQNAWMNIKYAKARYERLVGEARKR